MLDSISELIGIRDTGIEIDKVLVRCQPLHSGAISSICGYRESRQSLHLHLFASDLCPLLLDGLVVTLLRWVIRSLL
jgi:SUMO ligase MMS21 Smc5/6 complex component